MRFPIVFAAIYLGADVVEKLLDVIPEWLTHGLSVTGSTLPALGFAITIFIIGKNIYLPFFIIGFLRFSIWELAQWQLQSLEHV